MTQDEVPYTQLPPPRELQDPEQVLAKLRSEAVVIKNENDLLDYHLGVSHPSTCFPETDNLLYSQTLASRAPA